MRYIVNSMYNIIQLAFDTGREAETRTYCNRHNSTECIICVDGDMPLRY